MCAATMANTSPKEAFTPLPLQLCLANICSGNDCNDLVRMAAHELRFARTVSLRASAAIAGSMSASWGANVRHPLLADMLTSPLSAAGVTAWHFVSTSRLQSAGVTSFGMPLTVRSWPELPTPDCVACADSHGADVASVCATIAASEAVLRNVELSRDRGGRA